MMLNTENLKIGQKGVILVSVPMLIGTLFLIALSYMLYESDSETQSETRASNIYQTVERIGALIKSAQIATLYVVNDSRQETDGYQAMRQQRQIEFKTLEEQIAGAPRLRQHELFWRRAAERQFALIDQIHNSVLNGDRSVLQIKGLRGELDWVVQHENQTRRDFARELELAQQTSRGNTEQWQSRITSLMCLGISANVLLSLLLASLYSRGIVKRLSVVVDNSQRLSSQRPLNPRISGSDEIARLDKAFHSMVDHLEEAARKEKAIVDDAADVICSLDPNGLITAVNAAASKLWGYSATDLIGKPIDEIVADEDQETMRNALRALTVSASEPQVSLEHRIWCQNRSFMHMLWSIRWSQEQQAYFCVAHDITERKLAEALVKESEARTSLIVEGMPVGLLVTDDNSCIEMTNNTAEQMFALRRSELAGRSLSTLFSSEAGEKLTVDELMEKLVQPSARPNVELEAHKSTGDLFPAELSAREFTLNGQRKNLVVVSDISPRREVERLKQDFVSMVSHDLRTPLTSIVGTVQLLQEGLFGALSEPGTEQVEVTGKEVDRLITLVNSLLDIEKLEAGRMDLKMESAELASVVSSSVQSLNYLAEKGGIEIVTDLPSCKLWADSSSLVQVLVNLIDNAIKFSPPGSTITVTARVGRGHAEAQDMVEIRVQDQGRGIPESHRTAIFDRFKQVELADRVQKKGCGLGLAICKSIVEAHGGQIGVESEVGSGSTFWFTISSA